MVDVLSSFGVAVHVLSRPLPTPLTAFAVRRLGAAAGVVVTASHNPAPDNGYKVYAGDGAQIIPPDDADIAADADAEPIPPAGTTPGVVTDVVDESARGVPRPQCSTCSIASGPRDLRVVYTPMHGVGGAVLPGLLVAAGFDGAAHRRGAGRPGPRLPDPAVPEPRGAGRARPRRGRGGPGRRRRRARQRPGRRPARRRRSRAGDGGWRSFTGDELGILLAEECLRVTSGADRLVATTVVSSSMLSTLAAEAGVAYEETLTGFKWIARAAQRRPGHRLVFGYEEALGYTIGDVVADKDGMSAALVVAEMAARDRADGRSLLDRLDELSARLGVHLTAQWSLRAERSATGWPRSPPSSTGGGSDPPTELGGAGGQRGGRPRRGQRRPARRPTRWCCGSGSHGRVVLRPSGTEPKLKAYLEVTTDPPGLDGLAAARRRPRRGSSSRCVRTWRRVAHRRADESGSALRRDPAR